MKKLCLFLLVLSPALALAERHEVFGGTNASLVFGSGTTVTGKVGYNYTVSSPLQLGAQVTGGYAKPDGSTTSVTAITLLAGPTINFPFDAHLADAFFVQGLAGFQYASVSSSSSTDFAFTVELGKRFELVQHVSYRPTVGLGKVSGSDMRFNIVPVAFTFLF